VTEHRASLGDRLRTLPQYVLPHHLLSRGVWRLTRWRAPWFKRWAIRRYVRTFDLDLSEAEVEDLEAYPHVNSFFTRALKPRARPIDPDPAAVVSPVDGTVSQAGAVREGRLIQAKGHAFSLAELFADAEWARRMEGGRFATLYLSPRDYHRVHAPLDLRLLEMIHVPGRIFSVNPRTTRSVPRLFARNERVVAFFDSPAGPLAVVLVGAIFVSSIETVWAGEVTPPAGRRVRRWDYRERDLRYARGMEIGRFNMGSTVILVAPRGGLEWNEDLKPGRRLRMGRAIGRLCGTG